MIQRQSQFCQVKFDVFFSKHHLEIGASNISILGYHDLDMIKWEVVCIILSYL